MKKTILMFCAAVMLIALNSQADIFHTVGGADNDWASPDAWEGEVVPGSNDTAYISYAWNSTVTVASDVKIGHIYFEGGLANVTVQSGGSLTVDNSGDGDGSITHNLKNNLMGISVEGGTILVDGVYNLSDGWYWDDGDAYGTNYLWVSGAAVVEIYDFKVGEEDDERIGGSWVSISGNEATFGVNSSLYFGGNSVLELTVAADGTVSYIDMLGGGTITLNGGTLVVDLSAMTESPDEILLINNTGTDALVGTFGSVEITGSSDYKLSYTGGDGNDLSLVPLPKPPTVSLIAVY